ncbi:MAG: PAS domain-containing protein [Gammaproteobacteria bacterium]|nr:PAS domain-containing protein [Gammaproteobacteria bacterium]
MTKYNNDSIIYWLMYFLPLVIMIIAGGVGLLNYAYEIDENRLKKISTLGISMVEYKLNTALSDALNDLEFIGKMPSLLAVINDDDKDLIDRVNSDFINFSNSQKVYNQIRWIDETGREKVRVDYDINAATIVPEKELQNKINRYYVQNTLKLNKGEIYISPLDLNIENGVIEIPFNPMIRLGRVIYDKSGKKRGIVVLNYSADYLLNIIRNCTYASTSLANSYYSFLNQDGYFYVSPHSDEQWGFMLDKNTTFQNSYPQTWNNISANLSGQLHDRYGFWSYATINPIKLGAHANDEIKGNFDWKLVLHTPAESVTNIRQQHIKLISITVLILTIIGAIICYFIVLFINRSNIAENKSRQSQIKYTRLVESLPGVTFRCRLDKHWSMKFLSRKIEQLTGYPPDDFINNQVRSYASIIYKDDEEYVSHEVNKAIKLHQSWDIKYRISTRSGKIIWVNEIGCATYLNDSVKVHHLDGFILDYTKVKAINDQLLEVNKTKSDLLKKLEKEIEVRKITESKLQKSYDEIELRVEDRTRELKQARLDNERTATDLIQLMDATNSLIFSIDIDGCINDWNQAISDIMGYSKDDVIGHHLINEYITDDYKASFKSILDLALAGKGTTNYELPIYTQAGDMVSVLLNCDSRCDKFGNIIGVINVGQNITERKQTEALLMQSSKMASLGEMATGVAHELNQPLNIIRMASGNIMRRINKSSLDDKYLCNKLERIDEQTQRAASIIDHMRMFSRQPKHIKTRLDPGEIVHSVLGLIGEQLTLANIEIKLELAESCPLIEGEQIQIEQVLLNLLTNARDVLKPRQVGEDKRILIKVDAKDAGQVSIIVEDTGGGINENIIDRVFEPFFTTKEIGQGTGLGLSISYGIVREMGGSMSVLNTDLGTRFIVNFPVADKKE